MTLCSKCRESEEYIEILKDQVESKADLIAAFSKLVKEKDQEILLMKELLKGNTRMQDL